MAIKCRLCKGELELKFKSLGLIDTSGDTIPNLFLFDNEFYVCSKCGTKYKRELYLDRLVSYGEVNHRTKVIDEEFWKYIEENLRKNNQVLANYESKKKIYGKSIQENEYNKLILQRWSKEV